MQFYGKSQRTSLTFLFECPCMVPIIVVLAETFIWLVSCHAPFPAPGGGVLSLYSLSGADCWQSHVLNDESQPAIMFTTHSSESRRQLKLFGRNRVHFTFWYSINWSFICLFAVRKGGGVGWATVKWITINN